MEMRSRSRPLKSSGISELLTLPEKMQKTLEDKERIQWFAAKYANAHDVFFVGRGIDYKSFDFAYDKSPFWVCCSNVTC